MSGSASRLATDMMKSFRKEVPKQARSTPKIFQPSNTYRPASIGGRNPRASRLSQQELAIRFAKGLLTQGHHLQHKSSLEHISTVTNGSGHSLIKPHFTPSPLSSASLLASFLKHRLIRNQESVTSIVIRKIINLADPKNAVWSHSTSQLARKVHFRQTLDRLILKREALQLELDFFPEDSALKQDLFNLETTIRKTEMVINNLEPTVTGNLHPDSLLAGEKVSMTPTEAALLPSPAGTIRGVLIRVKGPRKGNRAIKQQKSSGRVSINSVGYVNYEECNLQLPSKLGIYGLYIRLVYSKLDRLVSPYAKLPVLDSPDFKFKNINTA